MSINLITALSSEGLHEIEVLLNYRFNYSDMQYEAMTTNTIMGLAFLDDSKEYDIRLSYNQIDDTLTLATKRPSEDDYVYQGELCKIWEVIKQ